ncbi:MAG: ABC transporter ATP-binding protein [Actinomycetota bacterium]
MTAPALQARSLTRRFKDNVAVDDVTFDVGFGEVVGLLGANGAGKTTTIRMLVGLLEPSAGEAMLLGVPPSRESQKRLGYVPQGLGLYSDLTVSENLTFTAQAYGIEPAALTGSLADSSHRAVRDLPLGLQRQLAFASAVQHTPEVLILDEPTSGVGPLAAARLWDQIRHEAERGAGVLVTTHSMQEARQCDRLVLLADGLVVGRGTEADIVAGLIAIEVTADSWSDAFNALATSGAIVTLNGRSVRVIDQSRDTVERTLHSAGITATVETVPATIDERMAFLATAATNN